MFCEKTVVITGASSGLGAALALTFAKLGANLVLFSRNGEKLKKIESSCRESGSETLVVTGDVTRPEDCKKLVSFSLSRFGTLDYLISNAGVSMWANFSEIEDISIFRKLVETNYLGAVYCVFYALPHLKLTKGFIVSISSIQGKIGVPSHTGYVASKHALQGFFESLRSELSGSGVDVLTVLPHWLMGTDLRSNAFGKDGKSIGSLKRKHNKESIDLQECCKKIINAIRKRKRELVIPAKLQLLPWLNLINPRIVEFFVRGEIGRQGK